MIKKICNCLGIILILIFCLVSSLYSNSSPIISYFFADIDQDERLELLTIETTDKNKYFSKECDKYGTLLCIYNDDNYVFDEKKLKLSVNEPTCSFDLSYINPMFVQAGDINGDGIKEISIVAYKTTKFHPVMAKRPFFYALSGDQLVKVWLGSRLSRPFDDFLLYDFDNDNIDEIISIEKTQDEQQVICVYDWEGFGFDMSYESSTFENDVYFLNERYKEHKEINIHTPFGNKGLSELINKGEIK